jgi:hypothetical protein
MEAQEDEQDMYQRKESGGGVAAQVERFAASAVPEPM